jgi:predicted phage baseplate assembly protein
MLPAPNLDDRRFQDLVDDAKRLVQRRCPEWTDHNVSDPGVTLIETFAYMTDQLLYRLNRVPDRLYIKFLELIGVRLLPPTPARAPVTFWLAAPAINVIPIQPGTEVSTTRTDIDDSVSFSVLEELLIIPCALDRVATEGAEAGKKKKKTDDDTGEDPLAWTDRTDQMKLGVEFASFANPPVPGDAFYVALTDAVPSNAIALQVTCHIDGVGVDPDNPPLVWESWNGEGWEACDLDHDETGGLNRDGEIVLHIPPNHTVSVLHEQRGGWIRARITEADEGQPTYSGSPIIHGLGVVTVGGTAECVHAELVRNEAVGESDGTPGQVLHTLRSPVLLGGAPVLLQSTSEEGWEDWTEVPDFADSGPDDRHYVFDAVHGEISLGPAIRQPDGTYDQYGWVPPRGAQLRMNSYAVGGGRGGNIARHNINVLRTTIPYISSVDNRHPAQGGVDGETLDEAKARGPIVLRTRSRAVTAEDYELLTKQAAPEIARVKCLTAGEGPDAGSVKVLIVPSVIGEPGDVEFQQLLLDDELLDKVRERLEETRLIGTRVLIEPPLYQGVTVVAKLLARPRFNPTRVEADCVTALFAFLNPMTGGPEGDGWPWGRPLQVGEIYSVLNAVRGVDIVDDVRIFGANPVTRERGEATQRLELDPAALVFSFDHQVMVTSP